MNSNLNEEVVREITHAFHVHSWNLGFPSGWHCFHEQHVRFNIIVFFTGVFPSGVEELGSEGDRTIVDVVPTDSAEAIDSIVKLDITHLEFTGA